GRDLPLRLPTTTSSPLKAAPVRRQSNEESVTTGAGSTNSNTVHFTLPTGATGGNVYRGTAAGLENVYYTVGPGATSFVDTGAAATSGSPPTTNSATASRTCTISLN